MATGGYSEPRRRELSKREDLSPKDLTHKDWMMCKTCFYSLRHKPDKVGPLLGKRHCPNCKRRCKLVHVVFVRDRNLYETTYVRKRESVSEWPVKCNPWKKCRGDDCKYAHGDEELKEWTALFNSTSCHGE